MMEKSTNGSKLHAGKWTPEEEAYVEGLMEEFSAGTLDLQEGTTLRSFLASKLNCKPKRISKKYEGKNYDGKQLYWNSEDDMSKEERRARRAKLERLESKFKEDLTAIQHAKASRQNPSTAKQECDTSFAALQDAFPQQHGLSPTNLCQKAETCLARGRAPTPPTLTAAPLFQRSAPGPVPADTALLLARHHRQQALELELELAASASVSRQSPLLNGLNSSHMAGAGHFGSLLSAPTSLQQSVARQEALLSLGSVQRPPSPSSLGLHFARPSSPRSAAASHSSLLAEAAALGQARLAMMTGASGAHTLGGYSSYRPSINAMLNATQPIFHAGRRVSGNALATDAFDESLMRLSRPAAVRDLEAAGGILRQHQAWVLKEQDDRNRKAVEDEWIRRHIANQAADHEDRKRQAFLEELSRQRKRQRFM